MLEGCGTGKHAVNHKVCVGVKFVGIRSWSGVGSKLQNETNCGGHFFPHWKNTN